jgi:pyridinium-3,5-biscarboxylic acid mononucleotide synthase
MSDASIRELLEQLLTGQLSIDTTVHELEAVAIQTGENQSSSSNTHKTVANTDDACVDLGRSARCGFPEVVYGEGKTADAIVAVFRQLSANSQNCLATRINREQADLVLKQFPDAIHNQLARTIRIQLSEPEDESASVAVVSAGTSDRPVAEEALETLAWMNVPTDFVFDIGVAGPQRLLQQVDRLRKASAIVVCAGMEGALSSVVGGYVACPIFAVPTSVGYGANFGGVAALLSMLNSCASNVAVVNIDAGFKGAYLAGLVASGAKIGAGQPSE